MAAPSMMVSVREILLEQTERTRQRSRADIQRFIKDSELKIASLESQISALIELRDCEHAYVAALRHLTSPIHTLPVELLAEIFKLVVTVTDIKDVFRISQVCSDWRQLAHRTTRLWTAPIRVELQSRTATSEGLYVDGLKALFTRSDPHPIHVSLVSLADHRIPEEVLRFAPRWRSLELKLPHNLYTPLPLVSQLAECRFDSLEELELERAFRRDISDPSRIISFSQVPRLRKLRMKIYSNAMPILIPWDQLTDLVLDCETLDIALDILSQCRHLVIARVVTRPLPAQAERDILALSHMRALTLELYDSDGFVGMPILDYLLAPALEELFLNFAGVAAMQWAEAFTAFQLRSPNITRLALDLNSGAMITSDDLMAVIRHAPSLNCLKLSEYMRCLDDAFIGALYYQEDTRPLLPRLHSLILHVPEPEFSFTEAVLAGMIASRWWTDAELALHFSPRAAARWGFVQLQGGFSTDFTDMMKTLQHRGLPLVLLDTSGRPFSPMS
ncbi:hypothetical protein DFH08DRAFT_168138 [Mycena albidolilacea]|uniref:F-box domain-containing protein n=1 Tax=Mycena albidolilacea TaxID=1033008 RepID=A0AAD7AS04_9AGAR|nr:hypothetical protein DFH08DRAFT_168138 [Mycena albidolilacea]